MGLAGGEIAGIVLGIKFGIFLLIFLLLSLLKWKLKVPTKGSDNTKRLDSKVVVITGNLIFTFVHNMTLQMINFSGANAGIGKITAIDLAKRGAKVIICCRNAEKATEAAKDIREESGSNNIDIASLDLASLKSVKECAQSLLEKEDKIDYLINNAGLICPRKETEDGLEMMMGTNHFGHFLFTQLLIPLLKKSAATGHRPRIINVSSLGHKFCSGITFNDINSKNGRFDHMKVYGMSKLANILHAKELAKRLKDDGISTYSLHPGAIKTNFGRHVIDDYPKCFNILCMPVMNWVFTTPLNGAQTTLYCVLEDSIENESGEYYSDCAKATPSSHAQDEEMAKKLWDLSEEMVGGLNA